jgi:APA family basic amino acid/polyamine antiporter
METAGPGGGPPERAELRREIGLVGGTAVIVGGVIGSGIFFKPYAISQSVQGPVWVYLLWAVVGLVCLFGAFAYAELGCLLPEAGGQYAFLREGWGRFVAFLYGWCFFLVINTGTLAALAVAFADVASDLAGLQRDSQGNFGLGRDAIAIGMVLFLAAVNHFGVRFGALLQTVSTFAKVAGLLAIVVGGFLVAAWAGGPQAGAAAPVQVGLMTGLASAAMAIFWAYEGWYQLPFNAAEMKNPHRDLPRALIYGTALVIVIYLVTNAVYLRVVPFDEMRSLASDKDVPVNTIARIFGAGATGLFSYFLCLSVMGAANPCLLSSTRAMYAMSADRLLPRWFLLVHPRWGTPWVAIWTQALWAVVLILGMHTFKDLTVYVIFAALVFYALTVASIYALRRRDPERLRPYRCWGYPITPALFIAVALVVDAYTLSNPAEQKNALVGLGIIATGVPVYLLMRRRRLPAAA